MAVVERVGSFNRGRSTASPEDAGDSKAPMDMTASKSQKSCLRVGKTNSKKTNDITTRVCFSVGGDIESQAGFADASQEPTAKSPEDTPEVVIEVAPEEDQAQSKGDSGVPEASKEKLAASDAEAKKKRISIRHVENSQAGEATASVEDVRGEDEDSKEDSRRLKKDRKEVRSSGTSVSFGDNYGEDEDSKEGSKKSKKDIYRKPEKDRKSHRKSKSRPSSRAA
jgi:hypothetical protein